MLKNIISLDQMSGDGNFWPRLEHQAMFHNPKIIFIFQLFICLTYGCCVLDPRIFFYDDQDMVYKIINYLCFYLDKS